MNIHIQRGSGLHLSRFSIFIKDNQTFLEGSDNILLLIVSKSNPITTDATKDWL